MKFYRDFYFSMLLVFSSTYLLGQNFNYKENAVYIYNFIAGMEFPVKKEKITIGIFGTTKTENEIRTLVSKKSDKFIVKNITIAQSKEVDIIIIAKSSSRKTKEISTLTAKLPILIISESADQNYAGACICLFIDEEDNFKTKYQLSTYNLRIRGLTASKSIITNSILVR
ncbi:MAG: YfiR family protein [Crocinitomicaceae bacterium]|jgi:hypothetical protein|nr:YfiR family protein [Crocinitomicaceae bacterium]